MNDKNITEANAEFRIKRLQFELSEEKAKGGICAEVIARQDKEIERLTAENKHIHIDDLRLERYGIKTVNKPVPVTTATKRYIARKAIREFAERLKETNLYEFIEEYFENAELCYEVRSDLFNEFVDNLVKEMTGKEGADNA